MEWKFMLVVLWSHVSLISHFNIITMSDAYKTENPTVNCHILKLILILSRCKCAL